MNKHKKFIKDAYNGKLGLTMCDEWKSKIEYAYPEFKNTLEVGKWYKDVSGLICMTKNENGIVYGYGFHSDGSWHNETSNGTGYKHVLATKEDVEEALIKEAKKRGFKEGVKYKPISKIGSVGYGTVGSRFEFQDNHLHNGLQYIFVNGKWAEPIKTITKEEAEKQLGKTIVG